MLNLSQIESDLKAALKARDALVADTLRGLKSRIQNEQIAKMKELNEADIVALVRSEVKRRRDAVDAYQKGGRPELADKEQKEAEILQKYLPAQLSEQQVKASIEKVIIELGATAADFGKVMGKLKTQLGDQADGAMLAKLLKDRLK